MLYKLIKKTNKDIEHIVISLTKNGPIGEKIQNLDVEIFCLNMTKSLDLINKFFDLKKLLNEKKPDLIQTWLYHSDLIGGIASKLSLSCPLVWNIRHSDLSSQANKRTTILVAQLSAKLSNYIPDCIISCSKVAKDIHINIGYNKDKIKIIPNGFNVSEFNQLKYDKKKLYDELDISYNNDLIGMVGRYDPQKDYENLLNAALLMKKNYTSIFNQSHFVLCGKNIDQNNKKLINFLQKNKMESNFHLLGVRDDIPMIMAALDLFTLSSLGEGFPNVVGEAMASSTPCVVTNVGDSAYIVGDTGIVVKPKNSFELMQGWVNILSKSKKEKEKLGEEARKRIIDNFTIEKISKKYLDLYNKLINENKKVI